MNSVHTLAEKRSAYAHKTQPLIVVWEQALVVVERKIQAKSASLNKILDRLEKGQYDKRNPAAPTGLRESAQMHQYELNDLMEEKDIAERAIDELAEFKEEQRNKRLAKQHEDYIENSSYRQRHEREKAKAEDGLRQEGLSPAQIRQLHIVIETEDYYLRDLDKDRMRILQNMEEIKRW